MNNEFGPQFRREERNYNRLKSNAENLLMRLVIKGDVKIGSEEYNNRCAVIEYFDLMASRERERYDSND